MNTQSNQKNEAIHIVTAHEIGYDHAKVGALSAGISVWVRALLQNWRQGTVAVKDRSEVARSNKKPWKQKGTGRARAGTARSPLWRGGGIIFGPQLRTRTLKVGKKIRSTALKHLMSNFVQNNRLLSFNWQIEGAKPSTAQAAKFIKEANLQNAKLLLFVSIDDFVTYASFSNIPQVKVMFFDQANAFDVMNADYWVMLQKDMNSFKEMVVKWL